MVRRTFEDNTALPDSLHPVLRRIYAARRVANAGELENLLTRLPPASQLTGIDAACDLLYAALRDGKRILIVADFDADGATSCAVAVRALRLLGASDVRFVVPNRFEFGYGLTPEIVAVAAGHQPDLLITVDNGISSIDGVAAAKAHSMQVLITDHHLPGATLPGADAIVNPNQPGDGFPSKSLAGVGVIFYVMLALRARLRERDWFAQRGITEPNLAQLLDLVALGTVADVVPLDHVNRILVAQGLARIRAGACCAGIRALLEVAGRRYERIGATDLGFAVGPRLNAAGRLDDMTLGIECLLTDDDTRARDIAGQLDHLNRERRGIENEMQEQALTLLAGSEFGEPEPETRNAKNSFGLCLFDESWHQGVIGILASRIKDRYHRPVIAFAPANEQEIKGSARSIPGVHIRDVLDSVAAHHPGLLTKFGGHAMAAGLTLKREHFDAFRQAFDEEIRALLDNQPPQATVLSDGELPPRDLGLELAETLRNASPWGQGFPEPVFDGRFEIVNQRIVGEKHLKMLLKIPGSTALLDAIAFNKGQGADEVGPQVHMAYKLDVNEYQGRRSVQLIVEHIAGM
ncbi:MAG: single-stranded-DNA-specific exonuclease RecJ [Gammaproteobacteria bacterium]|nr:single-stranded-DNA-specific exonuclease RecJ [Gammaproteobacteria bacterium]